MSKRASKLPQLAILICWTGSVIALGAVVFQFFREGIFYTGTFVAALVAALVSIPQYLKIKRAN
ncbi:MAG: hypothetical protein ACPF8V_10750 [Luteibaculum sp.]